MGSSISFGGIAARRDYLNSSLVFQGQTATYLNTDGSATARNTFYDTVNNVMHSSRIDAGAGLTGQIMRMAPDTGVVAQRFTCGTGCSSGALPTADWVERAARLFYGNDISPGVQRITRVKVCATCGPSA